MFTTIGIEEAKNKLKDLIAHLGPNDEVVITENSRPVARLIAPAVKAQAKFGSCKGMLTILKDDDEHLDGFKEYVP